MEIRETTCCGVNELGHITGTPPAKIIQAIKDDGWMQGAAFYMFTMPHPYTWATNLVNYIHKHKLGKVYSPPPKRNPNSGNVIRAYYWAIDLRAVNQHKPEK